MKESHIAELCDNGAESSQFNCVFFVVCSVSSSDQTDYWKSHQFDANIRSMWKAKTFRNRKLSNAVSSAVTQSNNCIQLDRGRKFFPLHIFTIKITSTWMIFLMKKSSKSSKDLSALQLL